MPEFREIPNDDWEPPAYSKRGDAIIDILEGGDVEVVDYDPDSSIFWIEEGEGWDFWVDDNCGSLAPGRYLISGIRGTYHLGDYWGSVDDDVSWGFKSIEPTSRETLLGGVT